MISSMNNKKDISIVGLGRLGTSLAACFAEKGHHVLGFDENKNRRKLFEKGLSSVLETGLDEMLCKNRTQLNAASNYYNLVEKTQVTFVTIQNTQTASGELSTEFVERTLSDIGEQIKLKDTFHCIVVVGKNLPGTMDQTFLPILEKKSGKECGAGFGLCYLPDFTVPGKMLQSIFQTENVILGESDLASGDEVAGLLQNIFENELSILRTNFVNAEVARLAMQTYLATKVSFSNLFAEICENLPGADWSFLLKNIDFDGKGRLRMDTWLSDPFHYQLQGENLALRYVSSQYMKTMPLIEAVESQLRRQVHRIVDMIFRYLPDNGRVGILGLASTPNTDVIENSPGINLAKWLTKQDVPVTVFDPMAIANAREVLEDKVDYAASGSECFSDCDVIVVTTAWPEFANMERDEKEQKVNRPVVLDCCNVLDSERYKEKAHIFRLGMGDFVLKPRRSRADYDYSLVDLLSISNIQPN